MKIGIWIVLVPLWSLIMTGSVVLGEQASNVLYVRPVASGSGDCSSWENSCTLHAALGKVGAGDEIWVAEGIHLPTTGVNRSATFHLVNGVALYGGFVGNETDREQRNWQEHETILSGDIGVEGDNSDNSYHVVTGLSVDAGAILDGFTIAGGYANGDDWDDRHGGGMFNNHGSPTLTYITFSNNRADYYGGGMYNFDSSPMLTNVAFSDNTADTGGGMVNRDGSPTLTDVTFNDNSADYHGGGMHNNGGSPTLTNVTFSGNSAYIGGGMYNNFGRPTLTDVTFNDNSADYYGGGMGNSQGSSHVLTAVTFSNNSAKRGGGMSNSGGRPMLTDVTFSGNHADSNGGGMYNSSSSPTLIDVTFSGNHAGDHGGGMYNSGGNPTLTKVIFSNNSADSGGGGMHNMESSPTLTDVTFNNNSAKHSGGGICNGNSNPMLENVTFIANHAGGDGGGIHNYHSSPSLKGVSFSNNTAEHDGGGIRNYGSSPALNNVTFTGNHAGDDGGGIQNYYSRPTLNSVTFTGNHADASGGGMDSRNGNLTLMKVIFNDNSALHNGGGMYMSTHLQSPTLTDVRFSGNSANWGGGGMAISSSNPILINATFNGNYADIGGGVYNRGGSPTLTNVTFSGNAASRGGGMYNWDRSATLINCILWGNTPSQIFIDRVRPIITYSDVQGGYQGTGNIDANPMFVDADGPDNILGTSDDDLRLRLLSPAIDAGDNCAVPRDVTTDLGGMPRFSDIPWIPDTGKGVPPIVDMGAFERPVQDTESVVAVSGSADDTSVRLEEDLNRVDWHLVRLGQSNVAVDGFTYVNGFRFEDMKIPQGATVVNARLMLRYADWSQGLPVTINLHAEANDNALDFSNENPLASERAQTDASTPWTIAAPPEVWFDSPDLAPLVQEAVNRSGWQPGNALALLVESEAEDERRHYVDVLAYDMDPAAGARLYVYFTLSEPTPTVTPTSTSTPSPTVTPTPTTTATLTPENYPLYLPLVVR